MMNVRNSLVSEDFSGIFFFVHLKELRVEFTEVVSHNFRVGIRGTVVARWIAGQQVERSILRQGYDS